MTVCVSDTALFFVLSRLSHQIEFERFKVGIFDGGDTLAAEIFAQHSPITVRRRLRTHSGNFSRPDKLRFGHFGSTVPVCELLESQIPIIEGGYALRFVLLNHFAQRV